MRPETGDIDALIVLALEGLHRAYLPAEGLFSHRTDLSTAKNLDPSLRYSMMSLIGLARARRAGHNVELPISATLETIVQRPDDLETIGDIGLLLWADAMDNSRYRRHAIDRLRRHSGEQLARRSAMELAWLVSGLTEAHAVDPSDEIEARARTIAGLLEGLFSRPGALFHHYGDRRLRKYLPTFAQEIYPVLALAKLGSHFDDPAALDIAERCARRLCHLQSSDGGWGWIYNSHRGTLVDLYPVYSVHQDGMAPMALLELIESRTKSRVDPPAAAAELLDSVGRGLQWIHGNNELNVDMVVRERSMIRRSIRRAGILGRYRGLVGGALRPSPTGVSMGRKSVVNECRSYHLGWVLEAWCGRADIFRAKPTLEGPTA